MIKKILFFVLLFTPFICLASETADYSNWTPYQEVFVDENGGGKILQYFTPVNYLDWEKKWQPISKIENIVKFPEGQTIIDKKPVKLFDLPMGFSVSLSDNKQQAYLKDAGGNIIFDYHDAYISKGKTLASSTVLDLSDKEPASYDYDGQSLYFIPTKDSELTWPVKIYDAIVTTSDSGDTYIAKDTSTTLHYTENTMIIDGRGGSNLVRRALVSFTLPNFTSGTISKVTLNLYHQSYDTGGVIAIHELNHSWVEASTTWNKYNSSTSWSSPGGDYNVTAIYSTTTVMSAFNAWILMGTGATNPLTLNWNQSVNVLLKFIDEASTTYQDFATKENATVFKRPYVEISYTPPQPPIVILSTSTANFTWFMNNYGNFFWIIFGGLLALAFIRLLMELTKFLWNWYNKI